jgi:hypothetical protein
VTLEVWTRRVCAGRKAVLTGRQGTLQASGFDLAVGVDFFNTALELAPGDSSPGLTAERMQSTNCFRTLLERFCSAIRAACFQLVTVEDFAVSAEAAVPLTFFSCLPEHFYTDS